MVATSTSPVPTRESQALAWTYAGAAFAVTVALWVPVLVHATRFFIELDRASSHALAVFSYWLDPVALTSFAGLFVILMWRADRRFLWVMPLAMAAAGLSFVPIFWTIHPGAWTQVLLNFLSFGDLIAFFAGSQLLLSGRGHPHSRYTRNVLIAWVVCECLFWPVLNTAPALDYLVHWGFSGLCGLMLIALGAKTFVALRRSDYLS